MHADRQSVTLEHVARAAGVSRATASRALTGSGPASAQVRAAVREAADDLGYVPDPVARALVGRGGTRLVVGVVAEEPVALADAYLARVVSTAARVCDAEDLGVSLRWIPLARTAGALDTFGRDRTVRGIVLVNTTYAALHSVTSALRGRVVSIGVGNDAVASFDVDSTTGTTAVVEHLLRSGRRRVAMVTGPAWLPCAQRPVRAYRDAVARAGLPVRTVRGDFTSAAGRSGVAEALARWPDTDAVLGICDDVAVAGFDDIPAAEHGGPGLTTATHPVEVIAEAATRAVLAGAAAQPTWFPSELVVRPAPDRPARSVRHRLVDVQVGL